MQVVEGGGIAGVGGGVEGGLGVSFRGVALGLLVRGVFRVANKGFK